MISKSKIFEVFEEKSKNGKKLFTINLIREKKFFNENLLIQDNVEFREWDPYSSKLAAAILNNCPNICLRRNDVVLYLGCSHGYTASFVSDIIGKEGFVFAVDIAPRVLRDMIFMCNERKNIAPILADANKPYSYAERISQVDFLYQDIAQKNQVEIFLKNIALFLKKDGYALLAVKARSIDVTKNPKDIFKQVRKALEENLTIIDSRNLEPYQKDHQFFVCKNK